MKELHDKQIQELVEKALARPGQEISSDDKDFKAYNLLFEALKKEPEIEIPYNFSSKVVARLQTEKNRLSDLKLYAIFGLVILLGLTFGFVSVVLIDREYAIEFTEVLGKYKWVCIFSLLSLFIIHYLDQKQVKRYKIKVQLQ